MADIVKLIKLLESQDTKVSEDARMALRNSIDMGVGIQQLISYYAEHRSERALEMLCMVKEPHDKILMDSATEFLRTRPLETMILLGQIVQAAPSWVPKLAHHQIFPALLRMLATRADDKKRPRSPIPEDISAVLLVASLLPYCSSLGEKAVGGDHILHRLFVAFTRTCDSLLIRAVEAARSRSDMDQVHVSHLQYAVRELFTVLYGIYPNNLIGFLRLQYKDAEDAAARRTLTHVIVPLLQGVRLHPNLLVLNKDKELSRDRWAQRESHDFLSECRRIVIGLIPAGTLETDLPAQPDSPPPLADGRVFASLFPPSLNNLHSHSSTSSHLDWSVEDAYRVGPMSALDTPPGSEYGGTAGGGQKRSLGDANNTIVVSSDRRRFSTGGASDDSRRRTSFRQHLSSIFTGSRRSATTISSSMPSRQQPVEPLIEVCVAEEVERRDRDRAGSENSQPEMAEEAEEVDATSPIGSPEEGDRFTVTSPERVDPSATTTPDGEGAGGVGVVRRRPVERQLSSTERELHSIQARSEAAEAARQAARRVVKVERERAQSRATEGSEDRSTPTPSMDGVGSRRGSRGSFRSMGREKERERERSEVETILAEAETEREALDDSLDGVGGAISAGGRSRFSVTSFFKKMNRQRFHSECPPLEGDEGADRLASSDGGGKRRRLVRTRSCPTLQEEMHMDMTAATPASQPRALTPLMDRRTMLDAFPYLKLIRQPDAEYCAQREAALEAAHEKSREDYMHASRDFHLCLKELGLADRLPGKIYDDMSHITKDIPMDKQRDILRTRLVLVNQHLMYERSCRLLHANRNRRLFGRIKQQKVTDAELISVKEKLHNELLKNDNYLTMLSNLRKEKMSGERRARQREQELCDELKRRGEEGERAEAELVWLRNRVAHLEAEKAGWRDERDAAMRRADDAEAERRMAEREMAGMREQRRELSHAHAECSQLRDQLHARGGGGEREKAVVEGVVKQMEAEMEQLRRAREAERKEREQWREKAAEWESQAREEARRVEALKEAVDRAGKMLAEQQYAAEQKFLSLQKVLSVHKDHIEDMYRKIEEKNDELLSRHHTGGGGGGVRPMPIPIDRPHAISTEVRSYDSSICGSDVAQSYFLRDVCGSRGQSRERDDMGSE